MQKVSPLADKANRFAAIDDVSDQIFDEIIPKASPDHPPEVDRSRVRTRLLDFAYYVRASVSDDAARPLVEGEDGTVVHLPTKTAPQDQQEAPLPFGWLVVCDGAGRGHTFALSKDVTTVGRGADQDVSLDFGDDYVSRSAHVTIHFEKERGLVAVRCGEKRNPVLLNGKLMSGTRLLKDKGRITLGQTTLRFVSIHDHDSFWTA